ncbi:MAG TPA: response regulator transcription factor [Thermoanaerobaculia bacterium]
MGYEVPGSVRVVVTGDQPLMRSAIARLIESESGLRVVAECANGVAGEAMNIAHDVVVMDLDLDACDADDVERLLAKVHSVILVTRTDDGESLAAALSHGVLGIVLKSRPAEVLVRAIRAVMKGEAWLEPSTLAKAFGPAKRRTEQQVKFTKRERQIVELVSLGLNNKTIALRLFISEVTVRHHLTSVYSKVGVKSRLELMRYAYSAGLVTAASDDGTGTSVPETTGEKRSVPPMRDQK